MDTIACVAQLDGIGPDGNARDLVERPLQNIGDAVLGVVRKASGEHPPGVHTRGIEGEYTPRDYTHPRVGNGIGHEEAGFSFIFPSGEVEEFCTGRIAGTGRPKPG